MKHIKLIVLALLCSVLSHAQAPISGPSSVCDGTCITLTDATPGGYWTSSISSVATVSSSTGVVCGLTAGVTTISYTVTGTGTVTHTVTVNALPTPITGPSAICVGTSATLSVATGFGTWSSSSVGVATISSAGVVTGVTAGSVTITYTETSTGCFRTKLITVNPAPAAITGSSTVCLTGTTTLSSATSGGTWSSASTAVAVVGASTGIITPTALGATTISYTLPTGCLTTHIITVTTSPSSYTVTGGGSFCAGSSSSISLSSSQVGVSYQLLIGGVATGSPLAGTGSFLSFGPVTSSGTYTIVANYGTSCATTMSGSAVMTINPLPVPYTLVVTGGGYCFGGSGTTITLSNSDAGVTYQLMNGSTAVGTPVSGTGSALSFGSHSSSGTYTCVETNMSTSCVNNSTSATLSVHALPTVFTVTGGGSYCTGGSGVPVGLTGTAIGVNYQLMIGSSPVGSPIAGTGTAISFGSITAAGTYTVIATNVATSCTNTMLGSAVVSVTPLPVLSSTLTPPDICDNATFSYTPTSSSSGATFSWSRSVVSGISNPAATGTGNPMESLDNTGTSAAAVTYAYTLVASGCTNTQSVVVNVNATPVITTSSTTPCGGAETITASGGSTYTWAPGTGLSCSSCSTTDAAPTTNTTYTVTGTDVYGCSNTATVSVSADRIAGQIIYSGGSSSDIFKVWLIQFNPSDSSITALDSTSSCMTGGVPYYEFLTPVAGSYLVKAKLNGTTAGSSGYIPTYSSSTPNWYSATSVAHTTSRDIADVNMIYGTVPPGPGFISGYVVSGAGKGTSGDVAEPGLLVYLYSSTGSMITYTYTDATGAFTFTGIAYGTYYISPVDYKYYTTPSTTITLNAASPSAAGVGFRKSTTYGTIKPYDNTRIVGVTSIGTISVYPVPASHYLYIDWPVTNAAATGIVIRDMQGRTVYTSVVDPIAANGHSTLDLNNLSTGLYHITISSKDIYYTSKLTIAR